MAMIAAAIIMGTTAIAGGILSSVSAKKGRDQLAEMQTQADTQAAEQLAFQKEQAQILELQKQEYRDCSAHWNRRLQGQHHTHIKFQLAYSKNPPTMIVEVLDRNVIERKGEFVYCFELGEISDIMNYPPPTD